MLLHYIKIASRTLARHRMLAVINIVGLSVGLACFSLFLLFTVHEFSYDRFHTNAATLYRVYDWWDFNERSGREPSSSTPLGPAMKSDLADVENFVRVQPGEERLVRAGDRMHRVRVSFADPQFFSVFTFSLIAGSPNAALYDQHAIVLTRERALQFFGRTDIVGQSLEIQVEDHYETFVVGGVAADLPPNSSIRFDLLGSFDHVLSTQQGKASVNSWSMTIGIAVFVQLRPGSTLADDAPRLAAFRQKYFPAERSSLREHGEWNGVGALPVGYGLQPLEDIHTNVTIDPWGSSDPATIWISLSIAAGILVIACINFIVLAIGRSAGRSKEVGVRKVIGGHRRQLVYQFLSESLLLSVSSGIVGLGLAQALLPFFNTLAGRSLTFSLQSYPELVWFLIGTVMLTGLLAGSYPALVLSGFKPVEALKNKIRLAGSNFFTKSLVTVQFVLSIALIFATVIILQQLAFMRSKDLGFNQEHIVVIDATGTDAGKLYPQFRTMLLQHPAVAGVGGSVMGLGAQEGQMGQRYDFNGKTEGVIEYPVDAPFLDVMDMKLVAGRMFDAALTSDTVTSVIVNEALVHTILGTTPEKALGMILRNAANGREEKMVIGVVHDFNYEDLTRAVRPQLFSQPVAFRPSRFFVRIKPGDPAEALLALASDWERLVPDVPFTYSFLGEKFAAFYTAEERWSAIAGWAGGVSIFLACLGFFGLASLAVANRTKEIGIRKVLGASVTSIVYLLSGNLVVLVVTALIIATPLAWYAMDRWLQHFAYRIELQWWVFALTGMAAIATALLTAGLQSVRAAFMDPVDSLKSE